jgi:hypothetical protein
MAILLDLYEHVDLLAELRRLRTRYTAGTSSVVNPRVGGSHGDLAQALALAVFENDRRGLSSPGPDAISFDHAFEGVAARVTLPDGSLMPGYGSTL